MHPFLAARKKNKVTDALHYLSSIATLSHSLKYALCTIPSFEHLAFRVSESRVEFTLRLWLGQEPGRHLQGKPAGSQTQTLLSGPAALAAGSWGGLCRWLVVFVLLWGFGVRLRP